MLMLVALLLVGRGPDEPPAPMRTPPAQLSPPATPPPTPAPEAPAASLEGLRLHGVAGAGAIIGTADGNQRLVTIGREVRPGLLLAAVGVDHALLRAGQMTYRLGFDGSSAAGPGAATGARPTGEAALREEILRYRLALAPVTAGGRVTGHVVREGARVPALEGAGIRPGDVIQRVNGADFDAERREELAWTLANTDRTTFEILRNGQAMRLSARQ